MALSLRPSWEEQLLISMCTHFVNVILVRGGVS